MLSIGTAHAQESPASENAPPEPPSQPVDTAIPSEGRDSGIAEVNLSSYEPVYFIVGKNGADTAKFQISFKHQLFHSDGWFSRNLRAPTGVYLGYTQTTLWDLDELSSPFKDTSYKPRVFYLKEGNRNKGNRFIFDLESGFAHESNGKADPESRGVNQLYIDPTLSYYLNPTRRFYIGPKVNWYLKRTDNPDIANYRGHVDLVVGYGSGNRNQRDWSVWTLVRRGQHNDHGSVEVNVAAPWRRLTDNRINGWLLLQYFNGYGESLIDYNVRNVAQFRIGLGLLIQ